MTLFSKLDAPKWRFAGPRDSKELRRIKALPRRTYSAADAEALAKTWTLRLRKPGGTQWLRPIQGLACEEAYVVGGLFGAIGVGWGKSLISLLLPTVWGSESAALLVPPELRSKLFDLEYPVLSKHWLLPKLATTPNDRGLHVVSYSQLSSPKTPDYLERLGVDDLILDEGHCVFDFNAARTKRFYRVAYTERPRPAPPGAWGDDGGGSRSVLRRKTAVLSGSAITGAFLRPAAIGELVLGDGSPWPRNYSDCQAFGFALDGDAPPGALGQLCHDGEPVRSAYRRRIVETPGVVATTDNDPGMALLLRRFAPKVPKAVAKALEGVRDGLRPDGEILMEAVQVYACSRQVSSGFYYRYLYSEPKELVARWIDARRHYFSEVRTRIARSIPGQDSEALCRAAAKDGRWASAHYARWADIEASVQPEREVVWLSRFLVEAALRWAQEAPGIVWVEAEAAQLAFELGLPVYTSKDDVEALQREDGTRSVVASINALHKGINLQAFHRNLVLTCPPSARLLEQCIGRTHRHGQTADEVTVDLGVHTAELSTALETARHKALQDEELSGNRQKLLVGTWV